MPSISSTKKHSNENENENQNEKEKDDNMNRSALPLCFAKNQDNFFYAIDNNKALASRRQPRVVQVVQVVFKTKKLSSKQKNKVVFSIMEKTNNTPRGIRNGNPLNIRRTLTKWKGMRETQTDKQFCQFDSLAYGYRAAFILLKQYYRKYRLKSISGIISRWAPPQDNNQTDKYITFVCHKAGVEPNEQLPYLLEDPMLWFNIIRAMAHQENGQTAGTMNDVILGYVMAFENEIK